MKVKVYPSVCTGEIQIPPSKVWHIARLCVRLWQRKSVISNIAYSDDILATIAGMRSIGCIHYDGKRYRCDRRHTIFTANTVTGRLQ